nr:MAG TPA: hypothetical protein [Caudoviricetes sp.]
MILTSPERRPAYGNALSSLPCYSKNQNQR